MHFGEEDHSRATVATCPAGRGARVGDCLYALLLGVQLPGPVWEARPTGHVATGAGAPGASSTLADKVHDTF